MQTEPTLASPGGADGAVPADPPRRSGDVPREGGEGLPGDAGRARRVAARGGAAGPLLPRPGRTHRAARAVFTPILVLTAF